MKSNHHLRWTSSQRREHTKLDEPSARLQRGDFKLKFLASESTLGFQCSCSRVGSVLQSSVGKLVVEPTQRPEGVMAVDVRYYYFVVYRKITTFLGFVPHPRALSTHL